jgi:hypothetical protein
MRMHPGEAGIMTYTNGVSLTLRAALTLCRGRPVKTSSREASVDSVSSSRAAIKPGGLFLFRPVDIRASASPVGAVSRRKGP